jgi:hypothetical protein
VAAPMPLDAPVMRAIMGQRYPHGAVAGDC